LTVERLDDRIVPSANFHENMAGHAEASTKHDKSDGLEDAEAAVRISKAQSESHHGGKSHERDSTASNVADVTESERTPTVHGIKETHAAESVKDVEEKTAETVKDVEEKTANATANANRSAQSPAAVIETESHRAAATAKPVPDGHDAGLALLTLADRDRDAGLALLTLADGDRDADAVFVPGSAGVQTGGSGIRIVPTIGTFQMDVPTVIGLEPVSFVSTGGDVIARAGDESAGPAESAVTPPELVPEPTVVAAPGVENADAVSRFVPYAPGTLDGVVRRFLDGLKSQQNDGMSLGLKAAIWTSALCAGVVAVEFARRKKLPQKAARYLSLTRLLSKTKTRSL